MAMPQPVWRLLSCPGQISWMLALGLASMGLITPAAEARIRLTSAPAPNSTSIRGSATQGAEGLSNFDPATTTFDIQRYQVDGTQLDIDNLDFDFNGDTTDPAPLPDNVIGNGTLLDVVQTAADVWETAFGEIFEGNNPALGDLDLGIGWANFSLLDELVEFDPFISAFVLLANLEEDFTFSTEIDGVIAYYLPADQFPENFDAFNDLTGNSFTIDGFPEDGLILFNSNLPQFVDFIDEDEDIVERRELFLLLDGNPLDITFSDVSNSDSFFPATTLPADINTGRIANPNLTGLGIPENAIVVDLFTVALHEIQHALGLTASNLNLDELIDDEGLLPTEPGEVPTTFQDEFSGAHISAENFTVTFRGDERLIRFSDRPETINPTVGGEYVAFNRRKCLSAVDIYAAAAASGLEIQDLDPCRTLPEEPVDVPEPGSVLGLLALVGAAIAGRKSFKS